ncbi:unnamed protein product [Cylicocyclus nassatus]|uniref:Uncharacterized protein n=1 Tax=Cylicocyclus nassatus TaxID=53992 RepID=A0AA36DQL2_CYLNA|nr:unnamed protein product [Cylicocyclus nassatus]
MISLIGKHNQTGLAFLPSQGKTAIIFTQTDHLRPHGLLKRDGTRTVRAGKQGAVLRSLSSRLSLEMSQKYFLATLSYKQPSKCVLDRHICIDYCHILAHKSTTADLVLSGFGSSGDIAPYMHFKRIQVGTF